MTAWGCPYCNGVTTEIYRCTSCGKDLTDTHLEPVEPVEGGEA